MHAAGGERGGGPRQLEPDGLKGKALSDFLDMPRSTEWLPKEAPPPRRGGFGTFVRRALTVVLCFSLGVALAAGALVWQGRDELLGTRIEVSNLGEPPASEEASEPEQGLSRVKNVLLVGSDSSDEVSEDLRDVATGDRSGVRTDTVMLLRIDPERKEVTGINFPRDLNIPLCDGSQQRINAAVFTGGPNCLVKTVRDFAGVRIDHYVQVDFEGFVKIVEVVNGVTMYLEEPMEDPKAHLDLPAGCVTLDGRAALGFVRTRADTDFGRIARQQRFLKELADEATSLDVVANPVRLFQMVNAVSDMLTTDDSLGVGTMRDFATTLAGVESDDIHMATVPTISDNSTGAWYEFPIEDQTHDLVRAFKRGELAAYLGEESRDEASESPSEQAPEPKIPLDEIEPIAVLNASDVNQLAARTADVLADAGVAVTTTSDTEEFEPARVEIRFPGRLKREAKSLQVGAFPDAVLEKDRDVDQVTVVLNSDFDPDLMEVAGAPEPESPAIQQREFANAEPPKGKKNC
jgi:LCP family protein required for cell wall assembly